jgi:hypothetical protein
MNSLPSDAWLHIMSYFYDNSGYYLFLNDVYRPYYYNKEYYPLELTILKAVSKYFNHLVSYFKNNSEMSVIRLRSRHCSFKYNLTLNLYYYKYVISNKYYGLLNELKDHAVSSYDGIEIINSIHDDLYCVMYFTNNPLITIAHDEKYEYEYGYGYDSVHKLEFGDYNCLDESIADNILHETRNKEVKDFLMNRFYSRYKYNP